MGGQKGQVVGYVRVSSVDQNEVRQVEALGHVDRLFIDRISGSKRHRPELDELLTYVREGDVVLVKSADRLARSTTDLLGLLEDFKGKGVEVRFVDTPALDTGSAQGKFMLTILGAVAELERATIRERQAEGIAIAKARGVYDRGPKLSPEQVESARVRVTDGVSKTRVARDLGVSRQTLHDALSGRGRYKPR